MVVNVFENEYTMSFIEKVKAVEKYVQKLSLKLD